MEDNETYKIRHEGSKQHLEIGLTVGKRNLFVGFSTRKGDIGAEYLTKQEAKRLTDWLSNKLTEMEVSK